MLIGELMVVGVGNVSQAVRCHEGHIIINMYVDKNISIEECIEFDAHMKMISVLRAQYVI